ncbi:MAG TPA: iron-containing redox enzyme family protein [Polyangia bacterium]
MRAKLGWMRRPLDAALEQLWAESDPARAYTRFLIHLHHVIRASVPLMDAARARSLERASSDPVCAGLSEYFAVHIDEERGHDTWALEDLDATGVGRQAALASLPPAQTAALVGAQYYWIEHHHPVALLGYIFVLEDGPADADLFLDELRARSGFPEAAFRTMRHHGRLDADHRADLDRLVDRLPLTRMHKDAIGVSLAHTAASLAECILAITA